MIGTTRSTHLLLLLLLLLLHAMLLLLLHAVLLLLLHTMLLLHAMLLLRLLLELGHCLPDALLHALRHSHLQGPCLHWLHLHAYGQPYRLSKHSLLQCHGGLALKSMQLGPPKHPACRSRQGRLEKRDAHLCAGPCYSAQLVA
jgi:hypothetical protein